MGKMLRWDKTLDEAEQAACRHARYRVFRLSSPSQPVQFHEVCVDCGAWRSDALKQWKRGPFTPSLSDDEGRAACPDVRSLTGRAPQGKGRAGG
jgi:hypothetical protein